MSKRSNAGSSSAERHWPKQEGVPFDARRTWLPETQIRNSEPFIRLEPESPWGELHDMFYDGLLRIDLRPTKYLDGETVRKMGLGRSLNRMLRQLGLIKLVTEPSVMYPEAVRQFLASVQVWYPECKYNPQDGFITYMFNGEIYKCTIGKICELFGIMNGNEDCRKLEKNRIRVLDKFWDTIGSHRLGANLKSANIRHPALRIVAKVLGMMVFGQEEASAIRVDEIILLFLSLPRQVREQLTDSHIFDNCNIGSVMVDAWTQKKFRGIDFKGRPKREYIGSLLTRIFLHNGLDLSGIECIRETHCMDEDYFFRCDIFRNGIYRYLDFSDTLYCELPKQHRCGINSVDELKFNLPEEEQVIDGGQRYKTPRQNRRHPRRSATRQPNRPGRPALPAYDGQFEIPAPRIDATPAELYRYAMYSGFNTMVSDMWCAVQTYQCHHQPYCYENDAAGPSTEREDLEPEIEEEGVAEEEEDEEEEEEEDASEEEEED